MTDDADLLTDDAFADIDLIARTLRYDGRPICPRCSNGYPICADFKVIDPKRAHHLTCARYTWADGYLCGPCADEIVDPIVSDLRYGVFAPTGAGSRESGWYRTA